MFLNKKQISDFQENGYLFFPQLFDRKEVDILKKAVPEVLSRQGPEVVREKGDPTAARLAFGVHRYSEPYRRLTLLPSLVNPVRQLLQDEIYLHQTRMNPKQGFGSGSSWTWHQDFPPWHQVDGMPTPNCSMASVFIDDCTAVTSPLLIIPGSQKWGLLDSELHPDAQGRGYDLYHISQSTLQNLAEVNGIVPLLGSAGSVALIHSNLVHGSADNVSPWRRAILYLIYNAVGNACKKVIRPWYQNNRDFSPLVPIEADALRNYTPTQ